MTERDRHTSGRLTVQAGKSSGEEETKTGVQRLGLDSERDGFLYIPQHYAKSKPAALAVMLHGAGAPAEQGLSLLRSFADDRNIILIAPAARTYSWDIIASKAFGPDVIFIEQALAHVFGRYAIDPERVAIGGFSDGASYALSLGLTNGDLFTHIIAFSPGFAYTLHTNGNPAVFLSHGIRDAVLPIDPCGRRIVPQLQHQGIEVRYTEFDGGHEIPASISRRAVDWFTGTDE
ncbi:alpha/beta hydrolase [Pontibacter roseus]|uniref:alpha/beta hydrolase n=1 Tax=Pontibacter roseus TaxID=336989 RepID=UPI0003665CEB|nr:alpha/beta hydrolase-fold protein [Pontibacter roseus]